MDKDAFSRLKMAIVFQAIKDYARGNDELKADAKRFLIEDLDTYYPRLDGKCIIERIDKGENIRYSNFEKFIETYNV